MHIVIRTAALPEHTIPITNDAATLVRMGFNPSQRPRVEAVKALAAALISHLQPLADVRGPGSREAAIAITHLQTASMFGVAAETADLS
jgi:hypothetical protein